MAEISETGLTIRRYPEIVEAIRDSLREKVSVDLDFSEDTLISQIVDIISLEISRLEEIVQSLDDSWDRDKAQGSALDRLLYLVGVRRIPAGKSAGIVSFITREGVTIPRGAVVANSSNNDRFVTTQTVSAITTQCIATWFKFTLNPNATYVVQLNGTNFDYTATSSDEVEDIVVQLVDKINSVNSTVYRASHIAGNNGESQLLVESIDSLTTISVSIPQYAEVDRVLINAPAESDRVGGVVAAPQSIDRLISGAGGVFHVFNKFSFGVGRLRETDDEYRARASGILSVSGSATYSALFTALRNVPKVSNLLLLENSTGVVDAEGLPPHSFEAIVDIPDTEEDNLILAQTIWDEKPIGIESFGNIPVPVTVTDINGRPRQVRFSRPTHQWISVRVKYSKYEEENIDQNLVVANIQDSILSYADKNLTTGVDVIPKRFIGGIYQAITGLDNVIVECQTILDKNSIPNPSNWSEDRIPISARHFASFDRTQIEVIEV